MREFFETYDPKSGSPGYNYRKEGVVTLYAIWNNTPQPKIIFDANGGTFKDDSTTDSKNFKAADSMKDDEESEPLEPNKDKGVPTHSDELKIFKGWTTEKYKDANADEVIDIYLNGDQLTKQQVKELFNGKDTVVLYAVWEKVKPSNNRTLWEQMQYLIAKNVYNDYWYAAKAKYGSNPKNSPFVYKAVYKKNWSSGSYQTNRNKGKWTDSYGISRADKTEYVLNGKHYNEPSERLYYVEENTLNKGTIDGTERYYIDFLQTHDSNIKVPDSEKRASGIIPNGGGYTTDENGVRHYYNRYFGFEGHYYGNVCRVHSLINVNDTYDVRSSHKKNGEKIDDDPIYFRIEAEPYISERTPIRQIVININSDNTPDLKRPLFFFYDGPDARTTLKDDGTGQKILNPAAAQPVILNLNADFKGVLWMPNIPVVINGNGHKFEGFIIAKEYRYLDTTQGMQVKYSSKGETDKEYSDNKIRIYTDSTEEDLTINKHLVGDVYTKAVTKTEAMDIWRLNSSNTFNLSSDSKFRTFKAETKVNYTYIYYNYDDEPEMDRSPFYDYSNPDAEGGVDKGTLVPLYKLDAEGNQVRILNWNDVKLYDRAPEYKRNSEGKPIRDANGNMIITNGAIEIPKKITTTDLNTIKALAPGNSEIQKASSVAKFKGIVLLDKDNNPRQVYDEAGNPVYFCKSYVKVRDQYDIFTLNKMDDNAATVGEGMRSSKEFLLTADTTNISSDDNVSDTDDWK